LGANGVVMMRFDVSDARDMGTEVCAYGTAVTVHKLS
ncbi:MAG: heavy metal-binding domain-containing protein, partial [Glycomyces artemisiae]|nr:heavy metal-binding domain-containing protein [Glycomyces artemisiae]